MHLGIDLRIADRAGMERSGLGRYALELAGALALARPSWRLSLFSNRGDLLAGGLASHRRGTRWPTQRSVGRIAWLHAGSLAAAGRQRPDVWFGPSYVLPAWWRGPSVVTVQDLVFLVMRERYRGRLNARYATAATRLSCRKATRVICPSRDTSRDLSARLGIDPAKICLIPNGVSEAFFAPGETVGPRDENNLPELLYVGTFEARKGLDTLYEAMLKINRPRPRARLLLAGKPGWGAADSVAALRREPWVDIVLEPSDRELGLLYRQACGLVYPSRMEGFGLPVAEAIACGGTVIASDLTCIRDFAGDAPLYAAPGDADQLAERILELLRALPEQIEQRRIAGQRSVAALRWSEVAESVARTIEAALVEEPPA